MSKGHELQTMMAVHCVLKSMGSAACGWGSTLGRGARRCRFPVRHKWALAEHGAALRGARCRRSRTRTRAGRVASAAPRCRGACGPCGPCPESQPCEVSLSPLLCCKRAALQCLCLSKEKSPFWMRLNNTLKKQLLRAETGDLPGTERRRSWPGELV